MHLICFDIGGSYIRAAVAQTAGSLGEIRAAATPLRSFEDFLAVVRDLVAACGVEPDCMALSITGVVDPESGILTCANIPCLHGRGLKQDLESAFSIPVLIANDADCFALAEAGLGAGRGHHVVLGAILGSGVGGGLVVGGRLANETGGFAGEWGHGPSIASFAGDPPFSVPAYECGCGQRRCLNTVGGARGMERLHLEIHRTETDSRSIVEGWQAGEADACRTVDIYVDLLASPLALAVNITGASIVPVGGGLARSAALLKRIDATVRQRTLRRFDRPLVVASALDVEPGLIGATLLALGSQSR